MFKQEKGVTLVALVITIIVLLILAGVSIAMLTGDNGILTKATKAASDTKVANAKEVATTDVAAAYANFMEYKYVTNVATADTFKTYITTNPITSSDTTLYTISGSAITIIPKTNEGKSVTGAIQDNGSITWTESASK